MANPAFEGTTDLGKALPDAITKTKLVAMAAAKKLFWWAAAPPFHGYDPVLALVHTYDPASGVLEFSFVNCADVSKVSAMKIPVSTKDLFQVHTETPETRFDFLLKPGDDGDAGPSTEQRQFLFLMVNPVKLTKEERDEAANMSQPMSEGQGKWPRTARIDELRFTEVNAFFDELVRRLGEMGVPDVELTDLQRQGRRLIADATTL